MKRLNSWRRKSLPGRRYNGCALNQLDTDAGGNRRKHILATVKHRQRPLSAGFRPINLVKPRRCDRLAVWQWVYMVGQGCCSCCCCKRVERISDAGWIYRRVGTARTDRQSADADARRLPVLIAYRTRTVPHLPHRTAPTACARVCEEERGKLGARPLLQHNADGPTRVKSHWIWVESWPTSTKR